MKPLRLRKETKEVKITIIVFTLLYIAYAIINLFPIYWSIINTFKTAEEFFANNLSLPKSLYFDNYARVFTDFRTRQYTYVDMLYNSVWIVFMSVFCNVAASAMLAYPVAKYRFPGKEVIYALVIFVNTIPIIGGGAAGYKLLLALGMIDNPSTIWFSWFCGFDFAFIVFYGTFKGIDKTYSEAAKIDGANNVTIFLKIILPQAVPSIAAIAITQAIGVWNNYSISMISLRSYPTLAYGLYIFDQESYYVENSKPLYFSAAIVSCLPVVILYGANQKLILENVTAGGLKG